MAAPPTLTKEEASAALEEALALFEKEENVALLESLKEEAGGDIMKWMQSVIPQALNIQKDVVTKYGFPDNQMGAMAFAMALNKAAGDDNDMKVRVDLLKAKFVPTGANLGGAK